PGQTLGEYALISEQHPARRPQPMQPRTIEPAPLQSHDVHPDKPGPVTHHPAERDHIRFHAGHAAEPRPPADPHELVTHGRTREPVPISVVGGDPRYFRSCGARPAEQKGQSTAPAPMRVMPSTTTCDSSRALASSTTSGPTWQHGPIRTPSPTVAPGATMAV